MITLITNIEIFIRQSAMLFSAVKTNVNFERSRHSFTVIFMNVCVRLLCTYAYVCKKRTLMTVERSVNVNEQIWF